jgi:WD40 repeat protein
VDAGRTRRVLRGHREGVNCVAFSSDGRFLASGSRDKTIRIWDIRTGHTLRVLVAPGVPADAKLFPVNVVAFSPNGRVLASGGPEGNTIRLWSAPDGRPLRVLREPFLSSIWSGVSPVFAVAFSADGRLLASKLADGSVQIWDLASGKTVPGPKRYTDSWRFALALSPDGRLLASGRHDGTILLWTIRWGEAQQKPNAARNLGACHESGGG